MNFKISVGLVLIAVAGALDAQRASPATSRTRPAAAQGRAPAQAPIFEVDPFWPKPLPNHWVMGSTIGLFVKEAFFDRNTLRSGSVWDMTFSRDSQQTYIFIANGVNEKISIVRRSTLEVLTAFGDGGRQPGQFFGVHNLDTDSRGNLYATETYTGARVQRFLYKGVGPVTKLDQGVPWPRIR